jgi:hypothetical protein
LIASNDDGAMRRTKQIVNAGEKPGLERELLAAVDVFVSNALEDSFKRGMKGFGSRRPVDWSNS